MFGSNKKLEDKVQKLAGRVEELEDALIFPSLTERTSLGELHRSLSREISYTQDQMSATERNLLLLLKHLHIEIVTEPERKLVRKVKK